jgi:hypothetical protein
MKKKNPAQSLNPNLFGSNEINKEKVRRKIKSTTMLARQNIPNPGRNRVHTKTLQWQLEQPSHWAGVVRLVEAFLLSCGCEIFRLFP